MALSVGVGAVQGLASGLIFGYFFTDGVDSCVFLPHDYKNLSNPHFAGDDHWLGEDRECVVLILLLQYPCGVDYASSVPSLRLVASRVPLHGIQFLIDQFH